VCGATELPNSRPEEELSREEPGNAKAPEAADVQEQDGPTTNRNKTILQHAEDAMNEHATLGTLLAQ
jgi:hypothetical protein